MAELKTKKTNASVKAFLDGVENEQRRKDAFAVMKLMREVTGKRPTMWGSSIVGFGSYKYKYASGHAGEWPITGFSPRKQDLTLYIMLGFKGHQGLMNKLGKHKTGKSCLYIKKLEDIHLPTLKKLVAKSYREMSEKYA